MTGFTKTILIQFLCMLLFSGCMHEEDEWELDEEEIDTELSVAQVQLGVSIGSTLSAGESMGVNDYLLSPNGKFRAVLKSDGRFILYQTSPCWHTLWSANGANSNIDKVTLTSTGNLEVTGYKTVLKRTEFGSGYVYNSSEYRDWECVYYYHYFEDESGNRRRYSGPHSACDYIPPRSGSIISYSYYIYGPDHNYPYWETETTAPSGRSELRMENNGNLVLYNTKTGGVLWETGTREQFLRVIVDGPTVVFGAQWAEWKVATSWNCGSVSYHWTIKQMDTGYVLVDEPSSSRYMSGLLPDTVPYDEAWLVTVVASDDFFTRTSNKMTISVY